VGHNIFKPKAFRLNCLNSTIECDLNKLAERRLKRVQVRVFTHHIITLNPQLRGYSGLEFLEHVILKDLVLEQAEGYVNALEKSTSWVLILREDFEHCKESY
jgi:hypothetical protein